MGITPLNNAVNDAQAIADLLQSKHDYHVWRLLDSEATGEAIQHYLKMELPRRVKTNDRFLFYFSGHGIQLNSQEGPEGYLVPQTARVGQSETYLSMHQVYQDLSALPCRHLLGILDCCFAGSFRWSSSHRKAFVIDSDTLYREKFDRFVRDPAWQVITSAAYDQLAYDAFDLKNDRGQDKSRPRHSPFAATLLEALEGGADLSPPAKEPGQKPGDGVITATELYQYVRDVIEPETDSHGMRQTPGLYPLGKHDKGEYIFLTPDHDLNLPPAPPLDRSTNPYQGLASFNETDQERYFGRTEITKELFEFFLKHQLTVVLGSSGSGKSSLVKAGLLPQLRKVHKDKISWAILPPFRPGDSPFQSLNQVLTTLNLPAVNPDAASSKSDRQQTLSPEAGLKNWFAQNPEPLVVVIDQFEELITRCGDEERQQFLESLSVALHAYPQKLRLVITLRSDFESHFQESPLKSFWQSSKFQVSALNRKELQQVIEEPAALRVLFFDPSELVDQLIDDVINMPGGLPLLSFALSELYLSYLQRQEAAHKEGTTIERAITQEDYKALGGVTHALIQRADEEYKQLTQEDTAYAQTIKQVMLRMVALGTGELARRPFLESEQQFPKPEQGRVQTVIDRFREARLLVAGKTTSGESFVEPAHDALVQGWKRLLDWKRRHLGLLILQRDLASDVYQWQVSDKKKKDYGLLWSEDPRLPAALQLSCGKNYNDKWHILFTWRFNYHRWQSQPHAYWLNNPEADFVWQSFDQKFKRFLKSSSSIAVIFLVLSGLTSYAWQRATVAQLQEQASRALTKLPTANAIEGLVLSIDTVNRSQSLPSLEMIAQSSLLSAVQVVAEINQLQGHEQEVYSVALSPDGRRIASGSADKTIRLWDIQTGEQIGNPFQGHNDLIWSVAFSPDGQSIASGSADTTIRLWDVQTGQQIGNSLKTYDGDHIRSVAFSPDGRQIASGGVDTTVRLWDVQTGEQIGHPLQGHNDSIWSVAFSPDGQSIASGSADKTIRLWDVQTGQQIGKPLQGHLEDISSIAFSSDGHYLVSGSGDTTVRLWDVQTGEQIGQPLQGHGVVVSAVAVSPDNKQIISGSWDKTVRLWDIQTRQPIGQPLQGHEAPVNSLLFSADGDRIISGSTDATVRLWNARIEQPIGESFHTHQASISSVAFSPNGQYIVSGSDDWRVLIWEAQTGRLIRQLLGHRDTVSSVAFSSDGTRIASGSEDNTILMWDAQTGERFGQDLKGHKGNVNSLAFSPDGMNIVSAGEDKTIWLWDIQSGQPIGQAFEGHGASVNSVAFSPDGKRMISGSDDKTLRLWNAQTGRSIGKPLKGHGAPVNSVAFSPDGSRIISSGDDRTIRIWNAQTGNEIRQLLGHGAPVNSVAFSPDGKRIVSSSDDWAVQIWSAQTGQPIGYPLQGHQDIVNAVAFSPNGKRIVSGSSDKTVRLWDAFLDSWLTLGCNRLRYHPLFKETEDHISEPAFREVTLRVRATCKKRVWGDAQSPRWLSVLREKFFLNFL